MRFKSSIIIVEEISTKDDFKKIALTVYAFTNAIPMNEAWSNGLEEERA